MLFDASVPPARPPNTPASGARASVFVTGACGLLGSWLVKALLDRGAGVAVLKHDLVSASTLVIEGTEARVIVVHGDICDSAAITPAWPGTRCRSSITWQPRPSWGGRALAGLDS